MNSKSYKILFYTLFMLLVCINTAKASCFESELISKPCLKTNGEEIYNVFSKFINIVKSEFETQSAFEERKAIEYKKIIQSLKRNNSHVGFIIGNEKNKFLKGEYSPESSILEYSIKDPFLIFRKFSDSKYYNASNAYGKNVKVEKYNSYTTSLLTKTGDLNISIPMNVEQAKQIKNQLTLYLFGNFNSEEPRQEFRTSSPTINDPIDVSSISQYIPFDATEIVVASNDRVLFIYSIADASLRSNIANYQISIDKMKASPYFKSCKDLLAGDQSEITKRINLKNKYGQTAIMESVFENDSACVEALFKLGADISIRDNQNQTPLGFAKLNKYYLITSILESSNK